MLIAMTSEKTPPRAALKRKPGPFGANLRKRREEAGWTQEELAAKAGVSRGTVANLETGAAKSPDAETVDAFAKAFGIPREELWRDPGAVELRVAEEATFGENPWAKPDDAARGPAMTIEEFVKKHGDDLTGREKAALTDMARTRPGTVSAWTEDDWLAWARSIRRRLGKEL